MKRKANLRLHSIAVICIITLFWCPTAALSALSRSIDIEVTGGQNGTSIGSVSIYPEISWDELAANPRKTYTWQMEQPLEITAESNPDNILATVEDITVSIQGDPVVNLGFSVTSGQYATSFSFSSDILTFDPLTNVQAYAKAYKAIYNDSTTFATLVDTIDSAPWSGWESTGWQDLAGPISSMQAKWQFILTANGMASGTSTFQVT